MSTYLICYDLADADASDYTELSEKIKSLGAWARITESTWAIVSEKTAKEIRDELVPHLKDESRIFVLKSGTVAAWRNVICSNQWLKTNL